MLAVSSDIFRSLMLSYYIACNITDFLGWVLLVSNYLFHVW